MNPKTREAVAAFKAEAVFTKEQTRILTEAREVSMKAQQVAASAQSIVETIRKGLSEVEDKKELAKNADRLRNLHKALEPIQKDVEGVWWRLDKKLRAKPSWKWQ